MGIDVDTMPVGVTLDSGNEVMGYRAISWQGEAFVVLEHRKDDPDKSVLRFTNFMEAVRFLAHVGMALEKTWPEEYAKTMASGAQKIREGEP